MKYRILSLLLTLLLLAAVLTGCGMTNSQRLAQIQGTWYMRCDDSQGQARELLDMADFYPEEIALVDLGSLDQVMTVTFHPDRTYSFGYDTEGLKQCVRDFYRGVFQALYDGRESLTGLYRVDLAAMTQEEFNQYYAEMYGQPDFESLLDMLAEESYRYDELVVTEHGTFSILRDKILCTMDGQTTAETIVYEITGDGSLKLVYADGIEVYSR